MHTLLSLSLIEDAEGFSYAFRNFLDAFYAALNAEAFMQMPTGADLTRNAFLAGTGDFLCNKYDLLKLGWLLPGGEGDVLVAEPPYFASGFWKTRISLLADSPQEFRQRNIFVGADSLSRA